MKFLTSSLVFFLVTVGASTGSLTLDHVSKNKSFPTGKAAVSALRLLNENLDSSECPTIYKPVLCGPELNAWFANLCGAKQAGYTKDQCVCYEHDALMQLMDEKLGANNCHVVTPKVTSNEDAVTLYMCEGKNSRATLVAKGLESEHPMPESLDVEHLDSGETYSTSFKNQCKDVTDAEVLLKGLKKEEDENPVICTFEWAPVLCGTQNDWFANLCDAKVSGGFHEDDCLCYEFEEIMHFMDFVFDSTYDKSTEEEAEKPQACEIVTPYPEEPSDAEVWYICESKDGTQATLVAKGLFSEHPIPYSLQVEFPGKASSGIAMIPFGNDCNDLNQAVEFLNYYLSPNN